MDKDGFQHMLIAQGISAVAPATSSGVKPHLPPASKAGGRPDRCDHAKLVSTTRRDHAGHAYRVHQGDDCVDDTITAESRACQTIAGGRINSL